jgi:hypothetical protein
MQIQTKSEMQHIFTTKISKYQVKSDPSIALEPVNDLNLSWYEGMHKRNKNLTPIQNNKYKGLQVV